MMSVQACLIKGVGYKFNYEDKLFEHIKDKEDEYDLINLLNLDVGYYELRDSDSNSFLAIVTDGMCGEYKYVLYITEAMYIENSKGDDFWHKDFTLSDWHKNKVKRNIELLLNKKLGEPEDVKFKHYE